MEGEACWGGGKGGATLLVSKTGPQVFLVGYETACRGLRHIGQEGTHRGGVCLTDES